MGTNSSNKGGGPVLGPAGYVIGPSFLVLAVWFLFGPSLVEIPEIEATVIHQQFLTTEPRRAILGDPPVIRLDGYERTCNDCHQIFPARDVPPAQLLRHRHIDLNHGINNRCRNCHDVEDRNRLVLHSGESIPFTQAVDLCAKCHGPTYRDWQRGMHGRANGFWAEDRGERRLLSCTECHDPHNPRVPAMDAMRPLPPPRTLRMRSPAPGHDEVEEQDPLRRALLPPEAMVPPLSSGGH